ncbi:MAG TPA: NAD(P)-dependent oxidoreductase [Candidatus Acidoferrales bacterium]|jgi:3-hydroxyisobutyrate dehydrogenase|nr:NAD(P)-dependent oxidoreductase [Candidatus Acidoferrales bacterium]
MKPSIGFIGLGLMGKPMAQNLLRAGFPLTVWNRTKSKAGDLVRAGAKLAANPREAAAGADVLITIVSDPPALEEVLFGSPDEKTGALEALRKGTILIDSSTVSPDTARRVAAACAGRGVDFLDAPVTGGTWGAEKGELVFMVGGEARVLERAKPVLEAMGKKFFLLGPNAAGQTVKLGMNLLLALEVDALAEALALVTKAGVAAERLIEVMQSSMGHAPLLDVKAPLILKNDYPASFPLRLMHKDLRLALELARANGVQLPAAEATYATLTAVKEASNDDPDFAALARFWKR